MSTLRTARSAAQHVVIAVPPALAVRTIVFEPGLPARFQKFAERTAVWMGGMVKAVAVYPEAFWHRRQLAGAAVSHRGPFAEVHDHSDAAGVSPALFGFAPAAGFKDASAADIASEFTGQLARLCGSEAARPLSVHSCDWSKERYTSPAEPSPFAAVSTYGAEEFHTLIAGRIHWASTETATSYAGHLEGTIHAGAQSADQIERTSRL